MSQVILQGYLYSRAYLSRPSLRAIVFAGVLPRPSHTCPVSEAILQGYLCSRASKCLLEELIKDTHFMFEGNDKQTNEKCHGPALEATCNPLPGLAQEENRSGDLTRDFGPHGLLQAIRKRE